MFHELQKKFCGELSNDQKEYILDINNHLGKGGIRGISFKRGISFLEFDMTFSEDFTLVLNSAENIPICFAYCSQGKVWHRFKSEPECRELENFQTAILTSEPLEDNVLFFPKDIYIKISVIVVNTVKARGQKNTSINQRLHQLLFKDGLPKNSVYIGSYNLKIVEQIKQLESISQTGIVRSLLIEGLVHIILALEIAQYSEDGEKMKCNRGSLTINEMDRVAEVSEIIKKNPESALCIARLSRHSGLSPAKLQEGFKLMHGRTVSDYIRQIRVLKAEELIRDTDLNISEIVYSIGFTSRSYFSKIFKKRFNCSPKHYKDRQQPVTIPA
jgi:AraC-like DNA-binding protein